MSRTNLVTTPFTATSTASDVVAGLDLSGRRTIVTGAGSGIGVETARALASAGPTSRSPSGTPSRGRAWPGTSSRRRATHGSG